jgi:hypothetical protein
MYSADPTFTTETGIHARVEVYAGTSAPVDGHLLALRVIPAAGGPAVITSLVPIVVGPVGAAAAGWLPVDAMRTGDYVLRVTVERDGVDAGAVEQPFRLERIASGSAASTLPAPPAPADAALPASPFDPAGWLAEGGATAIADAFGRAGVPLSDETIAQLSGRVEAASNPAATIEGLLVRAVRALSDRRLDAAGGALAALNRQLVRSPASLVLTGALFAAQGLDREAVGAWQTAEAAGTDDPAIAAGIVDALRRLGDAAGADARLDDALARWPSHAALIRRSAARRNRPPMSVH